MSQIKEKESLKALQGMLEKEKAYKAASSIQLKELKERDKDHDRKITSLTMQIERLKREDGLILSEHAALRYLQKVELIPIEEIYNKIVTEDIKKMTTVLGDGSFPLGDTGFSIIVKGNVIVTIK